MSLDSDELLRRLGQLSVEETTGVPRTLHVACACRVELVSSIERLAVGRLGSLSCSLDLRNTDGLISKLMGIKIDGSISLRVR